jgi:hypothetical protein
MTKFKQLSLSVCVFFAVLLLLNFSFDSRRLKRWFLAKNTISYFYIGYDWKLKLSRVLLGLPKESQVFLGSSRTAYGIDARMDTEQKTVNLGLPGASQNEILLLLSAMQQKNRKVRALFIEANPFSLSAAHIEINRTSAFSRSLQFSPFDVAMPFFPWSNFHVPMIAYGDLIHLTLDKLGKNRFSEWEIYKRQMHMNEFLWIDSHKTLGFIPGRIPAEIPMEKIPQFKKYLWEVCTNMIRWAMDGDRDFSKGMALYEQTLLKARSVSDKVVVWAPPATTDLSSDYKRYMDKMKMIAVRNRIPFLDFSKTFNAHNQEQNFLDCTHLNERGAETFTPKILEYVK